MVGYGNLIPRFKSYMRENFVKRLHSVAFRVTKEKCLDLPEIIEEVRTVELELKRWRCIRNWKRNLLSCTRTNRVSFLYGVIRAFMSAQFNDTNDSCVFLYCYILLSRFYYEGKYSTKYVILCRLVRKCTPNRAKRSRHSAEICVA